MIVALRRANPTRHLIQIEVWLLKYGGLVLAEHMAGDTGMKVIRHAGVDSRMIILDDQACQQLTRHFQLSLQCNVSAITGFTRHASCGNIVTPQGDSLSPIHFHCYYEAAMCDLRPKFPALPQDDACRSLPLTQFADDLDFLSFDPQHLEQL